jgi:hypothetical protein
MDTQEYMDSYNKLEELRTSIRINVEGLSICGEDIDMETEKIFLTVLTWINDNTEYIKFK